MRHSALDSAADQPLATYSLVTMKSFTVLALLSQLVAVAAFAPSFSSSLKTTTLAVASTTSTTTLSMSSNDDANFMRWAKAARYATEDDTLVELVRPLGLVLNQDANGNVYVETVAPRGNAARTGKVG